MICAGNWKLNKNPTEAIAFAVELLREAKPEELKSLVLFPPALCVDALANALDGRVAFGGQNCAAQASGAFTGENSAATLSQMKAKYCLVGHSERRALFGEADELLAKKVAVAQSQNLTPIFCIGETLRERESGQTERVLEAQLRLGLAQSHGPVWIAYEPVWAIGTGQVATTEQVKNTHHFIRQWLDKNQPTLAKAPLLYGGSVKPDNAAELSCQDRKSVV